MALVGEGALVGASALVGNSALVVRDRLEGGTVAPFGIDDIALVPNEISRVLITVGNLENQEMLNTSTSNGAAEIKAGEPFIDSTLNIWRVRWNEGQYRVIFNANGGGAFNDTTDNFIENGDQFLFYDHTSSNAQARIVIGTTTTQVGASFFNATFGAQSADRAFFDALEPGDKMLIVYAAGA